MSQKSHGHDRAKHEEPPFTIPVSTGFPLGVRISFVASVGLAVLMMALVAGVSYANHIWPSGNALHLKL